MITFIICIAILILGYLLYGRLIENKFGPDDRKTPAYTNFDLYGSYCAMGGSGIYYSVSAAVGMACSVVLTFIFYRSKTVKECI